MDIDINFLTSDNKNISVKKSIIEYSPFIKEMIEIVEVNSRDNAIPFTNINEWQFNKIIDWCINHINDEEKLKTTKDRKLDESDMFKYILDDITEWDKNFLTDVSTDGIKGLILISSYLQMDLLYYLCCKTIADRVNVVKDEPEKYFKILGLDINKISNEKEEEVN